jgi:hypothetical protein
VYYPEPFSLFSRSSVMQSGESAASCIVSAMKWHLFLCHHPHSGRHLLKQFLPLHELFGKLLQPQSKRFTLARRRLEDNCCFMPVSKCSILDSTVSPSAFGFLTQCDHYDESTNAIAPPSWRARDCVLLFANPVTYSVAGTRARRLPILVGIPNACSPS